MEFSGTSSLLSALCNAQVISPSLCQAKLRFVAVLNNRLKYIQARLRLVCPNPIKSLPRSLLRGKMAAKGTGWRDVNYTLALL
jgi:hypothetical protein